MKRISSSVFFVKWVFPFIYIAVVLFIAGGIPTKDSLWTENFVQTLFGWMPIIMLLGGFFALNFYIWPMMDEVLDSGSALIFRRGKEEVRAPYSAISRIARSKRRHNYSIIIYLKDETVFGSRLVFYPNIKLKYGVLGDLSDTFDLLDKKIRAHNSL